MYLKYIIIFTTTNLNVEFERTMTMTNIKLEQYTSLLFGLVVIFGHLFKWEFVDIYRQSPIFSLVTKNTFQLTQCKYDCMLGAINCLYSMLI